MLKQTDILKAVKEKLILTEPARKIYLNDVKENFQRPCYFIKIMPIKQKYINSKIIKVKSLLTITYFSNTDNDIINLDVIDKILVDIGLTLSVSNRVLKLFDSNVEMIGNSCFEYNILYDLNYYDYNDTIDKNEENLDTMQNIGINYATNERRKNNNEITQY